MDLPIIRSPHNYFSHSNALTGYLLTCWIARPLTLVNHSIMFHVTPKPNRNKLLGITYMLFGVTSYASVAIIVKVALKQNVDVFTLLAYRFLFAAIIQWGYYVLTNKAETIPLKSSYLSLSRSPCSSKNIAFMMLSSLFCLKQCVLMKYFHAHVH